MKPLHFIRHFPTYLKFYFTNWRYKKYGYRRFKFNLHIEQKDSKGNTLGFKTQNKNIIIHANYRDTEKLLSIPVPDYIEPFTVAEYRKQQLPFILLRDEHKDIFQACDHLTYKEII